MIQGIMACWGKTGQSNEGMLVIRGRVLPIRMTV